VRTLAIRRVYSMTSRKRVAPALAWGTLGIKCLEGAVADAVAEDSDEDQTRQ